MSDLILHHYPASPVSEKVRLALGFKGLAWRSVIIPVTMPRPDLMPLTGGYRRTPVLQIGADLFCDSRCILQEIERRHPTPTFFPGGSRGLAWAFALFTDRTFFQASVGSIFGSLPEGALPEAFLRDREKLTGRSFDLEAMRRVAPAATEQWHVHAETVERQLVDRAAAGDEWLLGPDPGLVDLLAAMNVWFVLAAHPRGAELVAEHPAISSWYERVKAFGHGEPTELDSSEALRIGTESEPDPDALLSPVEAEQRMTVAVTPDDTGRIPVRGELVAKSEDRVTIERDDEKAGRVHVHFPRLGYHVTPVE